MTWQQRDDNVPGTVYLLKAKGFHGIFPGLYLSRVKIGLTRNLEARLDTLHSAQPCTDLEVVHSVYVEDMESVETSLHKTFKKSNVKLIKSREWFNLNPIQVQYCIWLMERAKMNNRQKTSYPISTKTIAGGLLVLLGVGVLLGQSFKPEPQAAKSINPVEKSVKQR